MMTASLVTGCHPSAPASAPASPPEPGAASAKLPSGITICGGHVLDFNEPRPPQDFKGDNAANETELALFAWQHFIALNWPASYASNGVRGKPNTSGASFLHPPAGEITTVWETYRNKNEMYPAGSATGIVTLGPNATPVRPDPSYDAPPVYRYDNGTGPDGAVEPCDDGTKQDPHPDRMVNLDENSQLDLAYMFAQPTGATGPSQQVMFLAKVNQVNYKYIVDNKFYFKATQNDRAKNNRDNGYYGMCQQTAARCTLADPGSGASEFPPAYCLPCGGPGRAGQGGSSSQPSEGTIHIKAAWRRLTTAEANSGRYLTAPVVIYKPVANKKVCYSNDQNQKWGLVGLHIIHKTVQFPTFFFATWEHEDNLDSHLTYMNTLEGGPSVGQRLPYHRVSHDSQSLPSRAISDVNACVTAGLEHNNSAPVWTHYKLVGVQGRPVDLLDANLPNYYLANNVIESNDFFQSFLGNKGKYFDPEHPKAGYGYHVAPNLHTADKKFVDVGGCQGCHGNAQTLLGFDMSFITAGFADKAEAIGEFETRSLRARYLDAIAPTTAPPPKP